MRWKFQFILYSVMPLDYTNIVVSSFVKKATLIDRSNFNRYIISTHYMVYGEEWVTFYLLANTRHPLTWWQDAIEQVIQSCWHLSPNDGYGQGILQELPVYPGRQAETRNTILIKTKGPQALTVIWVSETSHWLLMRRAHICISTALS